MAGQRPRIEQSGADMNLDGSYCKVEARICSGKEREEDKNIRRKKPTEKASSFYSYFEKP